MTGSSSQPGTSPARRHGLSAGTLFGAILLSALLLVGSGVAYRFTSAAIARELSATIKLDPPLATLPHAIGSWQGKDVEIREAVQQIAGNDDFVNRAYRNARTGEEVMLYVGYTARPRTMLRHRPTVCYPSAGYSHVSTEKVVVGSAASAAPALLHRFLKAGLVDSRVVVLNYYVLDGDVTIDEDRFWGISWRSPTRANDDLRYVAQVQIMATVRGTQEAAIDAVQKFAAEASPAILQLLPRPQLAQPVTPQASTGGAPTASVSDAAPNRRNRPCRATGFKTGFSGDAQDVEILWSDRACGHRT